MNLLIDLFSKLNQYHKKKKKFNEIYDFAIENTVDIPKTYPETALKTDITDLLDDIISNKELNPEKEEVLRKKWLIQYAKDMTNLFQGENLYPAQTSLKLLPQFLYGDYQKKLSEETNKSEESETKLICFSHDVEIESTHKFFIETTKHKGIEEHLELPKDKIFYNVIEGLSWVPYVNGIDEIDPESNSPEKIEFLINKVEEAYKTFISNNTK